MKKIVSVFVFMLLGAMAVMAAGPAINLVEGPAWETITGIIGGIILLSGFGAWLLKKGFATIAGKIENGLEKTAMALDGAAVVARSAGFEKLATWTEEFADVPDQAGDVFGKLEEMTKNQDFTKERIAELYNEGREVVVEAKDFVMTIKKKE